MNDTELDALAARATAHTRAEARAIAGSDAALQRLLADAAADAPTPLTTVVPYHGPIRDAERRHRLRLLAVAAVLAALIVGIGYAALRSDTTIEIAGPPAGGSGTGTGLTTVATSTPPSTVSSTGPAGATAPVASDPPPTAPPSTAPSSTETPTTAPATIAPVPEDPFDGWLEPVIDGAALGQLPYLLPDDARWEGAQVFGRESESGGAEPEYTQVWVRTTDGTSVDAAVVMTTYFSQYPYGAGDAIDVPGWPTAIMWLTAPTIRSMSVASERGSVLIRAVGLEERDLIAIVSSMRVDGGDGTGWVIPADRAWVEVDGGRWSSGFASRSARVPGPDGQTVAEVAWASGLAVGAIGPGLLIEGAELGVTVIDGRTGLTITSGSRTAVVWSRDDGLTVAVGTLDRLTTTLDLAQQLVEVDRATWDAVTSPDPEFGDGCTGLFC